MMARDTGLIVFRVMQYPSSASTSSSDSDDSYTAGTSLPSQYPTITLPLSNTRLAPMAYTYGDDVYASQYPPYSSTQQQQNWPTDAHAQAQNQVDGQHGPAALSYPQMTVHAPVPLSFSFPLLNQPQPPSSAEGSYTSGPSSPHQNLTLSDNYHAPPPPPLPYAAPPDVPSSVDTRYSVLEYYRSLPQQTFPTPSELLGELGAGAGAHKEGGGAGAQRKSDNQRKARQRAVAQSIGFQPTEPYVLALHVPPLLRMMLTRWCWL
ncbi:hypothetical protein PLICRDRAFT_35415 [Plicaturopsis crispa FD-325 SS-3]|nr:hypothetical protein PLICRDRAFT_35415 [Plicaturopsis crispa FD-325 SS-3]